MLTEEGRLETAPIVIYERVVSQFRAAKTVAEINGMGERHANELAALLGTGNPYDEGSYYAIKEAFKYYRNMLLHPDSPVAIAHRHGMENQAGTSKQDSFL